MLSSIFGPVQGVVTPIAKLCLLSWVRLESGVVFDLTSSKVRAILLRSVRVLAVRGPDSQDEADQGVGVDRVRLCSRNTSGPLALFVRREQTAIRAL